MHVNLPIGLIVLMLAIAFAIGITFRLIQIRSLRNQVLELEKDKMQDHAEILQLQRKLSELQSSLAQPVATPVVPLIEKEQHKPDGGKGIRASQ
jgi:hypothetical protein